MGVLELKDTTYLFRDFGEIHHGYVWMRFLLRFGSYLYSSYRNLTTSVMQSRPLLLDSDGPINSLP